MLYSATRSEVYHNIHHRYCSFPIYLPHYILKQPILFCYAYWSILYHSAMYWRVLTILQPILKCIVPFRYTYCSILYNFPRILKRTVLFYHTYCTILPHILKPIPHYSATKNKVIHIILPHIRKWTIIVCYTYWRKLCYSTVRTEAYCIIQYVCILKHVILFCHTYKCTSPLPTFVV